MNTKRTIAAATAVFAAAASLTACAPGGDSADADGTQSVSWWTWDDKQAQSYKKCETAFEKANPDINVKISQYAWDDYWAKITAGFVGGNAPDSFMNHPSYYPEFASQGQLLPLNENITADGFDLEKYAVGLGTWAEFSDSNTYGLPKDWSSLAFYYNADMLADAGLTADEVSTMTWNPEDGGSYEDIVARLTVDSAGVRGDEPGFDKENVAVYGSSTLTGGGIGGQDTWAQFAPTTGWTLGDKDNWPTTFQYEDPKFVATAEWIRNMVDEGYMPEFGQFSTGITEQLGSKSVAMVQGGSWYLNTFAALPDVTIATAPSVVGPIGERRALSGSNADSIWAGSPNADAAWKWISYMGTEECQTAAGADGTFFPSIKASMDASVEAQAAKGVDLSAFTVHVTDGTLYEAPLYAGGTEVQSSISPISEAFWIGERDSDVFKEMDDISAQIFADNQ
jgi:ABC-type glycerol-3-phosphate transport system substrate-binding protein